MENEFLTNYSETTFLNKIKTDLRSCKSFWFSVSFIKKAGLVLLLKDIEAAVERGAHGCLITSTYQNFTDIESLKWFEKLANEHNNFECHLDYNSFHDKEYKTLGYHSKGYLFEFNDGYELIIGSSNITRYALLKNVEWDLVNKDSQPFDAYNKAMAEFIEKWNSTENLSDELISKYSQQLNFAIERWDMDYDATTSKIKPNYMQRKALKELNRYRAMGSARALVVAAAGSGKTYLAAFDALNFEPERLLYIVHEGSILKKSLESFQEVFGNSKTYGIFTGESKEYDADFVFATNITMMNNLELFNKDTFDYIIIDECHHATAESYKKIMDYFTPEFLLGLTATPERLDNQDVFSMFDENVPFELRLRDAIINDLIVPFKYYGIRDKLVEYGIDKSSERKMIAQISTQENCDFIATQIEKYRSPGKLKALAFCRNISHARMMAEAMSDKYHTAYLSGKNDIGERVSAYNDLQDDDKNLEILFTVDILNEGVDIPGVNMVMFLRPTESSTIFIQQLGRGLRKYPGKSDVVVLDFIGNSYKRSVQIAFALGSLSKNFLLEKKLLVSLVKDNFNALGMSPYGVQINIDDLSKEEIIKYIESENFNALKYLQQDYFNFKQYINAEYYPSHMDYLNNDFAPDLIRFMNIKIGGKKNQSYYNFLAGIGEEGLPTFSESQINYINYVSAMLPLVRPYEYEIIRVLLDGEKNEGQIAKSLSEEIKEYTQTEFEHAIRFMLKDEGIIENGNISLNVKMDDQLEEYMHDLISYGLTRYYTEFEDNTSFHLYSNYRADQMLLKICQDPKHNQLGTYVIDGNVYILASIKKDASTELNPKS